MDKQKLDIETVCIIGAGVSGVAAAVHLKRAGLDVTVYERTKRAGGIWVFNERTPKDPSYPSTLPSVGDSPEYADLARKLQQATREDSPMRSVSNADYDGSKVDIRTSFAPPGPCYIALKNNVSTIEMEMLCQKWKPKTEEIVPHHVMADYIQDSAIDNDVLDSISFNTRVNSVRKTGCSWQVDVDRLEANDSSLEVVHSTRRFDALVVANGHYHACSVPDIPGLQQWKQRFPNSISHSKRYRRPDDFRDQNVLLIGAGVSSMDIAKDLGTTARSVFQSSRGGPYDLPSHMLPANGARIGGIHSFGSLQSSDLQEDGSIPGTVTLQSGRELCNIHRVILCTGYHVSFPFMRQYHTDGVPPEDADETCLVTNGQQTHNLWKDLWYIPDPTLAFIGVPYHVATFSCFEFQAMALAATFSARVCLPSEEDRRREYNERIVKKGAGRTFHSLKDFGEEIGYVNELTEFVNLGQKDNVVLMDGHTQRWHEAYLRRVEKRKLLFSKERDPALDQSVIDLIQGC